MMSDQTRRNIQFLFLFLSFIVFSAYFLSIPNSDLNDNLSSHIRQLLGALTLGGVLFAPFLVLSQVALKNNPNLHYVATFLLVAGLEFLYLSITVFGLTIDGEARGLRTNGSLDFGITTQ